MFFRIFCSVSRFLDLLFTGDKINLQALKLIYFTLQIYIFHFLAYHLKEVRIE